MSKRQIEAVIFDLGETLLNFGRLDRAILFDKALRDSYDFLKEQSQHLSRYTLSDCTAFSTLGASAGICFGPGPPAMILTLWNC
ncbi:MAG: hypothetical protein ACYSPI_00890 [Planctomycetota bacterium]